MPTFHLGMDVAKAKLDCALRLPDGKFKSKVVENNPPGFQARSALDIKVGREAGRDSANRWQGQPPEASRAELVGQLYVVAIIQSDNPAHVDVV